MIFFKTLMFVSAFLCIGSACCVAHHFVWTYREDKSTVKEILFHWGVMITPLLLLAIFFIYNFITS